MEVVRAGGRRTSTRPYDTPPQDTDSGQGRRSRTNTIRTMPTAENEGRDMSDEEEDENEGDRNEAAPLRFQG